MQSGHLRRLRALVRHLLPSSAQQISECPNPIQIPSLLICFEDPGFLQDEQLCIRTAHNYTDALTNDQFKKQSLLNTNNDMVHLAHFIHSQVPSIKAHLFGRNSSWKAEFETLSISQQNVIFYYSGHGRMVNHDLLLTLSVDPCILFFQDVIPQLAPARHTTIILDCCYSGLLAQLGQKNMFILASASKDQVSGAWIMDGSDSGAIMTRFLTDPIGTWFKVKHHVFLRNEDRLLHVQQLHNIFDKHVEAMFKESDELSNVKKVVLESAGPVVFTLFKHFAMFTFYADQLFVPQTPISLPSIAGIKTSGHWKLFEEEMERQLASLWLK